jgi:hypothetical protein
MCSNRHHLALEMKDSLIFENTLMFSQFLFLVFVINEEVP